MPSAIFRFGLIVGLMIWLHSCNSSPRKSRILVFCLTKGWHHSSIPAGNQFFLNWGKKQGVEIDTTTNPRRFQEHFIKEYDAIVFLNTTGDVLNRSQEVALERYIQAGGSFIGIHAASDTEYEWPWYGRLVGAWFQNHPAIQKARLFTSDSLQHPLAQGLPKSFEMEDEWYNYQPDFISKNIKPILFLDEKSYEGGKNGGYHPAAWFQEFDGGKSFYTVLGHRDETYSNPVFVRHMENALSWALDHGRLDYGKAKTEIIPDEDRFSRTVLASGLDEPMEMAVEPDGDVWVIGRKGQIWRWSEENQKFGLVQTIPVWSKYEDGLLGLVLDRDFSNNHWVYMFYSPDIPESVQYLSRFTVLDDTLDRASEKILLKVPVQRLECCHSGGSLVMDRQGILWLSTGDNTNPHKSDGYSPSDERPTRDPFDAQKSSASTMDLRGKVLRIRPLPEGTYTIPEGNLFPPGTPKTRPEIFAMGCRNPFRISVNEEGTGVAWGDVGPDAGKDSVFGPMGHDEINLTYSPGFFGWPYFIANNKPYSDRKFSDSSKPGPIRNPAVPALNNSPRNMGMQVLPLARPAWIYYPYMPSSEFPELGKGGRTAMAGPWIPADANGVNLPSFYKGKLLIYDWMRGWVFAVDPDPDKKPVFYRTLTRFSLSKPMDIELGPDGNLYMLEYGTNWFAANPDARLSRLKYSTDNHEPVANLEASPAEGGVPLTVRFSAAKSFDDDPDDALHYEWRIESPSIVNSRKRETRFTFRKPGIYTVRLVVTDKGGKSAAVATQIRVGNYPPKLQFQWGGNSSFYWPGMAIPYEIKVEDPEDEASGGIRRSRIEVFADFMQNTEDQTTQAQGHQTQSLEGQGRSLIQGSDCKNCHQEKLRSAGPSWVEIGNRYRKTTGIVPKLANKIILGGAGVWGDHAMSAHPQLSTEDARLMVTYILSLEQGNKQILPATGRFVPNSRKENEKLILTAQYKDLGAPGMGEIETRISHILRTPKLNAQDADKAWEAFPKNNYGKAPFFMKFYKDGAFIAFEDVDLTQVKALHVHGMANGKIPLFLEVVCDSLKAPVLGSVQIREGEKPLDYATYQIPIKPTKGRRNLFLRLRGEGLPIKNSSLELEWLYFAPNGGKGI